MKKHFCIVIFMLAPLLTKAQQVTYKEDFSSLRHWSRVDTKSMLELSDEKLVFETKEPGITKMINSHMIDYQQDFTMTIEGTCTGSFTMLLNGSGDGYNSLRLRISSIEATLEKWKEDKPKKLGKEKFKPYLKLADGFTLTIIQKNKLLEVGMVLKGSGSKYTLYSDTYPIESSFPMFGFALYQGAKSPALTIEKVDLIYHQFEPRDINLIGNYESFGDKENLGSNINTADQEISQIISSDGSMLYFVREDDYQVPYYSELVDDQWTPAKQVSTTLFSSTQHNAVSSVSGDMNILYIMGTYRNGSRISTTGISKISKTTAGWSQPIPLKFDGYDTEGNLSNSISADQRYVVSALDNKKSLGEKDLFVFFRQPDGSYGSRTNLGSLVNTIESESTPYLAPDNKTLYFNSNGHPGYGEYDIFVTRRLDDTWTNWSKPENLGPLVNTPDWDGYYAVSAKGDFAYMTTYWQTVGLADIVRIELPEEAKPEKMVLVKGKVLDKKTGFPLAAEIIFNSINTADNPGRAISEPTTGHYQVALEYGQFYQIYASLDDYYSLSEHLDITEKGEYKVIEKNIQLTPIEIGEVFRLNNIFFETGSASLKKESFEELNRLIEFLNNNASVKIQINGHTDNVGSKESNLVLSRERALSVLNYLQQGGINAERISSDGYGETKPVDTNATDLGKAQNRRVEFQILTR
ncbi:MAG: OmpA family protein [Marinoscillum sp.]